MLLLRNMITYSLLIASACLYSVAFLCAEYCFLCAFIFLVPLYYVVVQQRVSFAHGYVWGMITISLHLSGVFQGIYDMAEGPIWQRWIPIIFIVLVQSLYAGAWFWISEKIRAIVVLQTMPQKLVLWILTTWLYFTFLEYAWMWLYGFIEGYRLLNPLIPLGVYPQLYGLLPLAGKNFLLLLLFITNGAITLCILVRSLRSATILCACASMWIISSMCGFYWQSEEPIWLERIAGIRTSFYHPDDVMSVAEDIHYYCKELLQGNSRVDAIFFPESAVYCEQLSTMPEMVDVLHSRYLGKPVHVVIGSFRWDKNKYRNSLHYIRDGVLCDIYDKRHAMALTERVPPCIAWYKDMKTLYFKTRYPIDAAENIRPLWDFGNGFKVVPYICSELFFFHRQDDVYQEHPILACCNDSWASAPSLKYLMLLGARMKACEWQRDIIYVTFAYTVFISKTGTMIPLYAEEIRDR